MIKNQNTFASNMSELQSESEYSKFRYTYTKGYQVNCIKYIIKLYARPYSHLLLICHAYVIIRHVFLGMYILRHKCEL